MKEEQIHDPRYNPSLALFFLIAPNQLPLPFSFQECHVMMGGFALL